MSYEQKQGSAQYIVNWTLTEAGSMVEVGMALWHEKYDATRRYLIMLTWYCQFIIDLKEEKKWKKEKRHVELMQLESLRDGVNQPLLKK